MSGSGSGSIMEAPIINNSASASAESDYRSDSHEVFHSENLKSLQPLAPPLPSVSLSPQIRARKPSVSTFMEMQSRQSSGKYHSEEESPLKPSPPGSVQESPKSPPVIEQPTIEASGDNKGSLFSETNSNTVDLEDVDLTLGSGKHHFARNIAQAKSIGSVASGLSGVSEDDDFFQNPDLNMLQSMYLGKPGNNTDSSRKLLSAKSSISLASGSDDEDDDDEYFDTPGLSTLTSIRNKGLSPVKSGDNPAKETNKKDWFSAVENSRSMYLSKLDPAQRASFFGNSSLSSKDSSRFNINDFNPDIKSSSDVIAALSEDVLVDDISETDTAENDSAKNETKLKK